LTYKVEVYLESTKWVNLFFCWKNTKSGRGDWCNQRYIL